MPCRQSPKQDWTPRRIFDRAWKRLSRDHSAYGAAWRALAIDASAYPNSANFLTAVWPHQYSLLLCETDPATVAELDDWIVKVRLSPNCRRAQLSPGDWRGRFEVGLTATSDLVFVSFDLYMFNRRGPGSTWNPAHMYRMIWIA